MEARPLEGYQSPAIPPPVPAGNGDNRGQAGKDLSKDMIGSILKQAGLTRKDLP